MILSAILHFISDEQRPDEIVRTFIEALPPGSYVLASHVTPEHEPRLRSASAGYRDDGVRTRPRTAAEFERLVFTGRALELVPPGVVLVSRWRRAPQEPPAPAPAEVSAYGGLGLRRSREASRLSVQSRGAASRAARAAANRAGSMSAGGRPKNSRDRW
ncbi:hypothetical protein E1281_16805 [Actinomadura sp. KC345]|nr:hypothetical protein E1281_16805 [Actinomadura sp. KC345]